VKEAPAVAKAPTATTTAAKAAPAPAAKAQSASTYVVRAGDTLYGIARKFDTAVDELMSLNKLTNAAIHPGLRLRLY
jgi:LysM repeat protein